MAINVVQPRRIGTCSLCGGDVMAYPQLKGCDQVVCATCGALRARPTPRDVIEMEQSPRRGWGGPTIREVSKMLTLLLLCGVLATPAAANGWFPSWSPSGAHLVSGSGDLSLDGAPLGIVGWGPVFEGEGSFLFTDAASGLSRYTLATRQVTQVRATGFNEIAAGGGVWAGWRSDLIDTSVGSSFSGAGNPTVNQSGALAYVTPRAALVRQLVIGGMVAATCECGELNLARQVAVWTQFTAPAGTWFQLPGDTPHKAAPPRDNEYRPIAIDTPSGPWVGNHTQTGLMLRRVSATDTHGYRFDNGGQAYYPAWVYRADLGAIVAAFSDQAGMLQTHVFPLDAPQVDLATLGAPPTSAPVCRHDHELSVSDARRADVHHWDCRDPCAGCCGDGALRGSAERWLRRASYDRAGPCAPHDTCSCAASGRRI